MLGRAYSQAFKCYLRFDLIDLIRNVETSIRNQYLFPTTVVLRISLFCFIQFVSNAAVNFIEPEAIIVIFFRIKFTNIYIRRKRLRVKTSIYGFCEAIQLTLLKFKYLTIKIKLEH